MFGAVWPGATVGHSPGTGAWTGARDLKKPPTETFRDWWVKNEKAKRKGDAEQKDA